MTNHNHSNNPVHQNSYQNNACGSKQQLWYELLSKVQKVSHKDFELLFNQIIEFLDENISNSTDKQYKESCIEKLVDIYLQTFSDRIFKILTSISSPLDECLLNTLMKKININGTSLEKRFNVFILISEIIHRSPSWLPNIINRSLLNWFFQILKNEQEIVILAISALILVELMAALPCHMSQCLDDIFRSKADIEKCLRRIAVFLRLYAMYPCNFLHFLKTNYGIGCNNKESCLVYVEIIEPMLAKIRFHPLLITSSKDQECDKSRWFYKEPHDILDECSQYSIDPVESTFFDFELSDLYRLFRKNEDGGDEEDDKSSPLMDDDDDENVEENFDSIYDQNSDSIFSELARQTESKKDINDVDLAKRRLNNPKTNSESAQEAIILSKKVSQTCAAPSCSMVDHRIDQQQNNLIKPVAVSAAENSFSSSSSKNPRANFQIKKQCFSPFKPINDSSEISDFSFDETSSDKKWID
ncbi:Hamartin [Sarcoptes scabiei]|uniref:Hamartin n=1 Tax=Sarcoptes scabiei TaxID=52283 RepID=A0A834RH76_SARSC|nr:Hamartin [Sarcoptes scabiei]